MSQVLSNVWSGDNRALQILLILAAVVLVGAIAFFIFRLVFGHRLRIPGVARSRQPRLGLVDAFSLDGQRQLVIVRRDNVEHLLMIGGPNDLVVESQILRVSAPASSIAREALKPAQPLPAAAAPPVRAEKATGAEPSPPPRAAKPVQPAMVVEESRSAQESAPVTARPPESAPVRISPPPRRAESTFPAPIAPPAIAPDPAPPAKSEPVPARSALITPPPIPQRPRPTPVRPPLPQPIGARPATQISAPVVSNLAPQGPPSVTLQSPAPASSVPQLAAPSKPSPAPVNDLPMPPALKPDDSFSDLESLEAEMARLLGRNP